MDNKELITILEALAKLTSRVEELVKPTEKAPKPLPPTRSKEIHELAAALSKAQGEFKIAGLTKENPFFKSKYADLAEIIKSSRAALAKNGLCVLQPPIINEDGANILVTILLHSSGQWMESRMRIVPPKADVQSLGSYMTYMRRYSYASLVGVVASDDDDDGEVAVHSYRKDFEEGVKLNHKYDPKKESPETITKEQLEELRYELKSHTDLAEEIMDKMRIQTLADMPKSKYMSAVRRIREIVQKRDGK
jgi:hypothetical protein